MREMVVCRWRINEGDGGVQVEGGGGVQVEDQ